MTTRQQLPLFLVGALLLGAAAGPSWAVVDFNEADETAAPFEREMNGEPRFIPNPADTRRGAVAITVDHIPPLAQVRFYTLDGRLLRALRATDDGSAVWDLCNSRGEPVEAGIYLALVTADGDRKAAKVAVQR